MVKQSTYQWDSRELTKAFRRVESIGTNWAALCKRPLYLYSVRRISATYAIGIVGDWNMERRFVVKMFPADIRMVESAQGITLAVGEVWKPDNKYGSIECEVMRCVPQNEWLAHFIGLRWVEVAQHQEITHYSTPERVTYNHEDYWLVSSTATHVTLELIDYPEQHVITIPRAEFERTEDVLGFNCLRVISTTENQANEEAA